MDLNRAVLPIDQNAIGISQDRSSIHLVGARCSRCGRHFFPKREICPSCFDQGEMAAVALEGRGKLATFTVVRRSLGNKKLPYALGYIDIPENIRIFSSLTDCDPERITIGMDMEVVFEEEETEEGRTWITYKFRPVKK
jgi:hypothetical protein